MSLVLVTSDYRVLVNPDGKPAWFPFEAVEADRYEEALAYSPLADAPTDFDPQLQVAASPPYAAVRVTEEPPYAAVRVTEEEEQYWESKSGFSWKNLRYLLEEPHLSRVVAQLRFREDFRFHPTTGEPLHHPFGTTARSGSTPVFPRIDPAVIGLVELEGEGRILLGRNRLRPDYFSLIAGYVGVGETLEAAWAREVLEETGRVVSNIRYWGSQPWPMSGSLMIAFRGTSTDKLPVQQQDSELIEVIWASREELGQLPLAAPGSIARNLIDEWQREAQE